MTGLVFPAGSVAVTITVCGPFVSGVVGVHVQVPPAGTTTVQSVAPPSTTATVLPGSALPVKGCELLLDVDPAGGVISVGASGAAVSTLTVEGAEAGLVLPAASMALAVNVCVPSKSGVVGAQCQFPLTSATVLQIGVAPSKTVTALPASAVPVITGCVLLVAVPLIGAVMLGAIGAAVSTTKLRTAGALALPAGSVAVARMVWLPSASVLEVHDHAPLTLAVVEHSTTPFSVTLSTAPASAVPVISGVLILVLKVSVGVMITGVAGASVSIVTALVPAGLVLPAGSVALALSVYSPGVSGVVGVHAQVPAAVTVVEHSGIPPAVTVITAPTSPVPVMVGVVSFTLPPLAGDTIAGATGAMVSILIVSGSDGRLLLPPLAATAVSVWLPWASWLAGAQLQFPNASVNATHTTLAPSSTVTVVLGCAVPLMTGVAVFTLDPFGGPEITGAGGVGEVPVPPSAMLVDGCTGSLVATNNTALLEPVAFGANETPVVQLAPIASVNGADGHVPLAAVNWVASVPPSVIALTVIGALPVLVIVTN